MAVEKLSISVSAATLDEVQKRSKANRSAAISGIIEHYTTLMARIKSHLRQVFSDEECGLMLDSLNGVWLEDDINIMLLVHNISDAIEIDGLDLKWDVDGFELKRKLDGCGPAELYAIADAVQIWWKQASDGKTQPSHGELFKSGGREYTLTP